jgi:hypothetical protein
MSSLVRAPAMGTSTIVVSSETVVIDDTSSTDYDSDDSYIFYDFGDEATESDDKRTTVVCTHLDLCYLLNSIFVT